MLRADRFAPRGKAARRSFLLALLVVLVETAAGLHTEAAGEHHALEERGWRDARVLELVEEDVGHMQVDVEAGVVDELERAHRVPEPELHRRVDLLDRRHALLECPDGPEEVRD